MTAKTAVSNLASCTQTDIWPSTIRVWALKVDSWSFALMHSLSFSQAPWIPQVPLTKPYFPLQEHSHLFLMFLMFGLPLHWLMRRHMAVVCYQIPAKLRGQRGNQNHLLKLGSAGTPVFDNSADTVNHCVFTASWKKQSPVSIELKCFVIHNVQCFFLNL